MAGQNRLAGIDLESFKSMSDEDVVKLFGECFAPELARLQYAKASLEQASQHPPGNLTSDNLSPSRLLYDGKDYAEDNRTLLSLLVLKWILTGNWETLTSVQPEATRLTRKSFDELQKIVSRVISTTDMLRALVVITVTNDVGKDESLTTEVLQKGVQLPANYNHDDVGFAAAKAGLLPLIDMLPADLKVDALLGFEMGTRLNIPQLAQAECVPGSMRHIFIMRGHDRAFELKFLEVLLDVAGAAGHFNASGSMAMSEPVYKGFSVCRTALLELLNDKHSLRGAYDEVLKFRGGLVKGPSLRSLSVGDVHDRALLRLLTIGRVATEEKALVYQKAFDSLPEQIREDLCNGMNMDGTKDAQAIIPYYAPALFDGATKGSKNSSEEAQVAVFASMMRFMARVYVNGKPKPGETDDIVERTLDFAKDTILSKSFIEDPQILDKTTIKF